MNADRRMKLFLVTFLCFTGYIQPAIGQFYDHAIQHELQSTYVDIVQLANGNFACLDIRHQNGGPGRVESLLVEIDQFGNVLSEDSLTNDASEPELITRVEQLSDGSLVLFGTQAPCDVIGFVPVHLQRIMNNQVIRVDTFSVWGFPQVVFSDSLIAVWGQDSVVTLDHNGIFHAQLPLPNASTRPALLEGQLLWLDNVGIQVVQNSGTISDSIAIADVQGVERMPNGNLLCITSDSLLLLNDSLDRTGISQPITPGAPYLWSGFDTLVAVSTGNTLTLTDQHLNILQTSVLNHAPGWATRDMYLEDTTVTFAGASTTFQAKAASIRNFSVGGTSNALTHDLELGVMNVDSIEYSISYPPGSGIALVDGSYWATVNVVNTGTSTLNKLTLNDHLPFGFCEVLANTYHFENLNISPGSDTTLSAGPFFVYDTAPASGPASVDLCIFGAAPNSRLELDLTNNESCGSASIPVNIGELAETWSGLTLFPNPCSDILQYHVEDANARISIHNASGKLCLQAGNEGLLNVSKLPTGIYQFTAIGKELLRGRFVVN